MHASGGGGSGFISDLIMGKTMKCTDNCINGSGQAIIERLGIISCAYRKQSKINLLFFVIVNIGLRIENETRLFFKNKIIE